MHIPWCPRRWRPRRPDDGGCHRQSSTSKEVEEKPHIEEPQAKKPPSCELQFYVCKTSKHIFHKENCRHIKGKTEVKMYFLCEDCRVRNKGSGQ